MEKELSNYTDVSNLNLDGTPEYTCVNKPVVGALVTLIMCIALFLMEGVVLKIIALIFILACIYILFIYKSKKVLSFYSDGLVAYKEFDDTKAIYLPYKRIKQWTCKRSGFGTQVVVLMLNNKDYIYAEAFNLVSIAKKLKKYMPDKEFKEKK